MPVATWSPSTYLQFGDERSRPFFDLLARVTTEGPQSVVDLGCGPGHLTTALAERWPAATVTGVDSSAEMIAAARVHESGDVRFELGDVGSWRPDRPVDVIVANAVLQWVPDHRRLLPQLLDSLSPRGWLAFQVPGNFDEPSHQLLADLAADPRFAAATSAVERPAAFDAATYLGDLAVLDCDVEAWETTYLHVLAGPDPVFRWISGTGARPVLQALSEEQREVFVPEYQAMLREAYPAQTFGTVLPFRRVFVVARRRGAASSR